MKTLAHILSAILDITYFTAQLWAFSLARPPVRWNARYFLSLSTVFSNIINIHLFLAGSIVYYMHKHNSRLAPASGYDFWTAMFKACDTDRPVRNIIQWEKSVLKQ